MHYILSSFPPDIRFAIGFCQNELPLQPIYTEWTSTLNLWTGPFSIEGVSGLEDGYKERRQVQG